MVRSVQLSLLVALVAGSGSLFAADIQQVGHRDNGCGDICAPEGCDGCNDKGRRSKRSSRKGQCESCDYCDPCGKQRCTMRSSWRDFGTNWTGRCGPVGRAARWGIPGARCLKYCMDTKGSGDSGWSPPARMPVNRTNTGFGSYANYGGGGYGGAPMVYQPTDTAQLGYTYAHVPTWKRNPNMIPRTPVPSNFHARFCPRDPRGGMCIGSGAGCIMDGGYGNCMGEQIIEGPSMGGEYCPACVSDARPTSKALPAPAAGEGVFRMAQLRQAPKANKLAPVAAKPQANIRLAAQTAQVRPVPVPAQLKKAVQPQLRIPSPQMDMPRPQLQMNLPQVQPQMPQPQFQPRPQANRVAAAQKSQPQPRRTAGRRQASKSQKVQRLVWTSITW